MWHIYMRYHFLVIVKKYSHASKLKETHLYTHIVIKKIFVS
jgi:hypothetical protein